tara:strand:+ start:1286 stop:2473 length:1188 start_codon:yes stop_codon:yes gene_type:complete
MSNLLNKRLKFKDIFKEINLKSKNNNQYKIFSVTKDGITPQSSHFTKQIASKDNTGYKILKRNNVAISPMNLWLGSIGVMTENDIGIVSPAYLILEFDKLNFDPIFLKYFLKSPYMLKKYRLNSYQGASVVRQSLDKETFFEEIISFPKLDYQKRVSQKLKKIDDLIKNFELKYQKIIFLKKSFINNFFLKIKYNKRNKLVLIDNWEKKILKDISKKILRKNSSKTKITLTISATKGLINQKNYFNKLVSSEDTSHYTLLKNGEFSYNKSSSSGFPAGCVTFLKNYSEGCLSPLYICFEIIDKNISKKFLECFFLTDLFNKQISEISDEGTRSHGMLNLKLNDFYNVEIPIPSLNEQKKFEDKILSIENLINFLFLKIEKLNDIKKYTINNELTK